MVELLPRLLSLVVGLLLFIAVNRMHEREGSIDTFVALTGLSVLLGLLLAGFVSKVFDLFVG